MTSFVKKHPKNILLNLINFQNNVQQVNDYFEITEDLKDDEGYLRIKKMEILYLVKKLKKMYNHEKNSRIPQLTKKNLQKTREKQMETLRGNFEKINNLLKENYPSNLLSLTDVKDQIEANETKQLFDELPGCIGGKKRKTRKRRKKRKRSKTKRSKKR